MNGIYYGALLSSSHCVKWLGSYGTSHLTGKAGMWRFAGALSTMAQGTLTLIVSWQQGGNDVELTDQKTFGQIAGYRCL